MVEMYVRLIQSGKWTLDRVPEPWHDAVRTRLAMRTETGKEE